MKEKESFQLCTEKKLNEFPFITLGQNTSCSTRYMSINLTGLRNECLDFFAKKENKEVTVYEREQLENIYISQVVNKEEYLSIETTCFNGFMKNLVEEFLQKNPTTELKELKLSEGIQALCVILENLNINAIPWTDYNHMPVIELIEVQFEFTTQLILNLRFKESLTKLNYVQNKFYEKFKQISWYNLITKEFKREIKNIATSVFRFDYSDIDDDTEADILDSNYCVIKYVASSDESETFIIQTTDL